MNREDIALLLVRAAGLWLLIQILMVIPGLLALMPKFLILMPYIEWPPLADTEAWLTLLHQGPVSRIFGMVTQIVVLMVPAAYLLTGSERLVRLIARK